MTSPCRPFRGDPARRRAFTIVEMMVAMAVLSLLVIMFAQAFGSIGSAWARAQEKMDNFAKARTFLNRLQVELQNIVIREDLAIFPSDVPSSDGRTPRFAFYTLQRGINLPGSGDGKNTRSLSYVEYAMGTTNEQRDQILRRDRAYTWQDDSPNFAVGPTPTPSSSPVPAPSPEPPDDLSRRGVPMAEGQLAFAYGFLHPNGEYSQFYEKLNNQTPSQAVAVTVGILVMDNKTARNLRSKMNQLTKDFRITSEPAGSNWSPKAIWDFQLGVNTVRPDQGALPKINISRYGAPFLDTIRAFERTYPLPVQKR